MSFFLFVEFTLNEEKERLPGILEFPTDGYMNAEFDFESHRRPKEFSDDSFQLCCINTKTDKNLLFSYSKLICIIH